MPIYLCSYRPMKSTRFGREAAERCNISSYLDSSCRKEPDFSLERPTISALCRAGKFAPKLNRGDIVVYITKKGVYPPHQKPHWRIVAILKITKKFINHSEAANWYKKKYHCLPSNCVVQNNPPCALGMTGGPLRRFKRDGKLSDIEIINRWDLTYQQRAIDNGRFLSCKKLYLNLNNPPILTHEKMENIFGRVRGTQNPPTITEEEFKEILELTQNKSEQAL